MTQATPVTLFHNPRCSKSRETLALLEQQGCQVMVREYLQQVPTAAELEEILQLLQCQPRELMRTKEAEYKALGLDDVTLSARELIDAMVATPKLIERPIALANGKAAVGRPPQNVLSII
jgi:arsenate reductase (glutaredoxin)